MEINQNAQFQFYMEMTEHQMNAHEFFGPTLLNSLERNFGIREAVISYFDTNGKFLSWATAKGRMADSDDHPYHDVIKNDVVRYLIYQEAVRDRLTYYNVVPRVYKAKDIIGSNNYLNSAYVHFIESCFNARYALVLAFGINAYIQITFFHTEEEGDFTEEEVKEFEQLYVYIANAYMTFKKYEQRLIVSNIQGRIITNGEKAYIVTDDFNHIMSCNEKAQKYIEQLLGYSIENQIGNMNQSADWLAFMLWGVNENTEMTRTRIIQNLICKIHTYNQEYSNGIVDRYHWITISVKEESDKDELYFNERLTKAEQKVAELMYNGLTYQEIANKLVVSYHTVKKHVQNIYAKCGVNSRYQLVKWIENQEK